LARKKNRQVRLIDKEIPVEATQALQIIQALLGSSVVAVYLYGSAVAGGLQKDSDVDVLAIVNRGLTSKNRVDLAEELMKSSGKMSNKDSARPLEVTIVDQNEVVPWNYPPKREFIYGEWLRDEYEQGQIPGAAADPDLTILLSQARSNSVALSGPSASLVLDPVPMVDIQKALGDSLPDLIDHLRGDERNVILTLARIWVTAATGEFLTKDEAARWVSLQLPKEQAALVDLAGKAYRGECIDNWENLDTELNALVVRLKQEIELCLGNNELLLS